MPLATQTMRCYFREMGPFKITLDLYGLIPPKWVPFNDPYKLGPIFIHPCLTPPFRQLHPNKSLMIHVSVPKLSNVQDKQTQTAKSPKSMLTSGVLLESVKHVGDGLSRMQLWEMSKLNNVM